MELCSPWLILFLVHEMIQVNTLRQYFVQSDRRLCFLYYGVVSSFSYLSSYRDHTKKRYELTGAQKRVVFGALLNRYSLGSKQILFQDLGSYVTYYFPWLQLITELKDGHYI